MKSSEIAVSNTIEPHQSVEESNVFTDARMNAIKAGKDTFVVHGKKYKVTGDTKDELEASVQESQLNEIDFAAYLDDRNFPKEKLISMGTVDGEIEGNNVMVVSSGDQKVYFLVVDDQIASFIGFENGYLKNIKNFTKSAGVVRALLGYLVHIKKQILKIEKNEKLTPDGIKWLSRIILAPRGLVIKDTNGKLIDVDALNKEWESAKVSGRAGPTGVVISELAEFGNKLRINESNRKNKSILMPYCFYEIPKQNIAESQLDEIGFSSALGDLVLPQEQIISSATVDGTIGSRPVLLFQYNKNKIYFFTDDLQIAALLYLFGDRIMAIKNFSSNKGLVYNLFQYVINIKQQKLRVTPTDALTLDGIEWIVHQIKRPTGFKITDINGSQINPGQLYREWETARLTRKNGPTEIVIGESRNSQRIRENEQRLMPMDIFGATLRILDTTVESLYDMTKLIKSHKKNIAEGEAEALHFATESSDNLTSIVNSFVNSSTGQQYKQHDCKTVTRAFVQWAAENKIPTKVINLAPPSAEFIKQNPQFKGKSGSGDGHIMPIVNNSAIDFTVRQFGVNRPFKQPLITPVNNLKSVYGRFGYFTDKPEWFLGGKSHWIGPLNSIPSEIFNQNFGDELLEQQVDEGEAEALHFATNAHAGQTRSGGDPYITHPMRVADHIRQYKKSHNLDALISAAYLHDTLEDTDTTHEILHDLFGGLVASLVKELTSDPEQIKKMGKAQYLAHKMAAMSSYALVIKLADRLDNVKDITTAKTPAWRAKYKAETEHILDYIEQSRALSGTHKKLISLIREKLSELNTTDTVQEADYYRYSTDSGSLIADPAERQRLSDINLLYRTFGHFLGSGREAVYPNEPNRGLRMAREFMLKGNLKIPDDATKEQRAEERRAQKLLLTMVNPDGSIKPRMEESMKLTKRATMKEGYNTSAPSESKDPYMRGYDDGLHLRREFNQYPKDSEDYWKYSDGYKDGIADSRTHWEGTINTKSMIKEFRDFKKAK